MHSMLDMILENDKDEYSLSIAKSNIEIDKLNTLYTTECALLEASIMELDAYTVENGLSKEDTLNMYTEAEEKSEVKKESLLSKIVNVIKTICGKIKEFFTNIFTKKKDKMPDQNEIPEEYEKSMTIFEKIWDGFKNILNKIKGKATDLGEDAMKFWEENKTKLVGIAGGAAIAAGATTVVINKDKISKWISSLTDASSEVSKAVDAVAIVETVGTVGSAAMGKDTSNDNKFLNFVRKVLDALRTFVTWISSMIKKLMSIFFKSSNDDNENDKSQPQNNPEPKKDDNGGDRVPRLENKPNQSDNQSTDNSSEADVFFKALKKFYNANKSKIGDIDETGKIIGDTKGLKKGREVSLYKTGLYWLSKVRDGKSLKDLDSGEIMKLKKIGIPDSFFEFASIHNEELAYYAFEHVLEVLYDSFMEYTKENGYPEDYCLMTESKI